MECLGFLIGFFGPAFLCLWLLYKFLSFVEKSNLEEEERRNQRFFEQRDEYEAEKKKEEENNNEV